MEVNNVAVTGMKATDIVRLLNDGSGSVVFKLVPAKIPTIVESGEKRFLRALVSLGVLVWFLISVDATDLSKVLKKDGATFSFSGRNFLA